MNNKHKVLFTGCTFQEEKRKELLTKGIEIIPAPANLNQEDLIKYLQDCEAVISNGGEYYSDEILSQCEKLKIIQFFGIGYSKCVDSEIAKKYGKIVVNTPKVNSYSVAEFTLGLMLSLNQKLLQYDGEIKSGIWEEKTFFDLKDKTIGIVGMGHIGTHLAEILYHAFHVKILFYDIVEKPEIIEKYQAEATSLEDLMKRSDIVSLHIPLNETTRNRIGEKELSLMKEHAYLINTARAEVVDYKALYNVLKEGKISGCAFDGFYQEPVDFEKEESILLSLPTGKFFLTPHTGYNAVEGTGRVEKMCIENLLAIFSNQPCKAIITK